MLNNIIDNLKTPFNTASGVSNVVGAELDNIQNIPPEPTLPFLIKITFVDGSEATFAGQYSVSESLTSEHRLLETKNSTVFMLEADGNLLIYPWSSIKVLEMTPCPLSQSIHLQSGLTKIG